VSGRPYSESQLAASQDPYGVSKMEAEQGLQKLAAEIGLDVVIIRSPLVYGPGVKANFNSLMRRVNTGIPLPLGAIRKKLSFVSIDNLISLITTCINHPKARNNVFLVSDGEDLSTTDLLERLGKALGKKVYLLPVPPSFLMAVDTLCGKREMTRRICGSLEIDISSPKALLGWRPQSSIDEGLCKTAKYYQGSLNI
jgi:nucleoside-diphosphate-sugar epimerase